MASSTSDQEPAFRTSAVLSAAGFRHAFFTRQGGVSRGPFASLNFSVTVGDEPDAVAENLRRAARALGVPADNLCFLSQVHGAEVHVVPRGAVREETIRLEGDAIVGLRGAVGVRIADCVPVLVGDRRTGAAAAIHAGWKGLVAGVIASGISRLRETVGGRGELVAAVGPHITVRAFEVSEDVAARLAACAPDVPALERHHGPKPHVSLAAIARYQLLAAGVNDAAIDLVPGCTYSEPEHFFSFRRDGARSGRHLAAIVPRA